MNRKIDLSNLQDIKAKKVKIEEMTPEYKKEVEKADERIRTAQIAQAEAVIKAKNDLYR